MAKLYESRAFLRQRYQVQKKSIKQIAAECGVTERTIYRKLQQFGMIKK